MEWLEPQEFSKHLRKAMTPAEYLLWQCIRNRQRCHAKFRRQYVKGIYTLDFYCPEAKLCVECDGLPHFTLEGIEKDRGRTQWLNAQGIEVVRFSSQEIESETQRVLNDIDTVLKRLLKIAPTPHPPTPSPRSTEEKGS
jgi:very-short-patch-repair endonuclease